MSKGKIRLIVQMEDVEGVEPETIVFQVLGGKYNTVSEAKRIAKFLFKPGMKLRTVTIGDMFVVQGEGDEMTELTNDRERLKEMLIDNSSVALYWGNKVYNMPLCKAKEIAIKMNITVEELIASEPEDDN